jgi:colanic acid/amylovoran biosynthesis glycosyltransferase
MRLAYIVSRFPHASETFIARELVGLEAAGGEELELLALFPPVDPLVHPSAAPFVDRLIRPDVGDAASALAWWALRRPLRLAASVGVVIRDHLRSPRVLARALATVPLAAAHARAVAAHGVDHVHAHYATYPTLSAWICSRLTGTPYSFTAQAHDIYMDQSMLARKLADAAFVVAISDFNLRLLSRYGDVSHVHVIRSGIDTSAIRFRPRAVPTEGPVNALCIASFQEYKGHSVLFEALAGSHELGRVQLDLVGGGPLREELERKARELGIAGRVRFLGTMREDEVRDLLDRADLLVLPSVVAKSGQMEGVPVALMEALAAGVPVVSTRLSGIPELIADGETGLLAEPGDPVGLREALERVVSGRFQPDLRAGRELVEREFEVADTAARIWALIEEAGGRRLEQTSSRRTTTT